MIPQAHKKAVAAPSIRSSHSNFSTSPTAEFLLRSLPCQAGKTFPPQTPY